MPLSPVRYNNPPFCIVVHLDASHLPNPLHSYDSGPIKVTPTSIEHDSLKGLIHAFVSGHKIVSSSQDLLIDVVDVTAFVGGGEGLIDEDCIVVTFGDVVGANNDGLEVTVVGSLWSLPSCGQQLVPFAKIHMQIILSLGANDGAEVIVVFAIVVFVISRSVEQRSGSITHPSGGTILVREPVHIPVSTVLVVKL